jgi:hypothetical protein
MAQDQEPGFRALAGRFLSAELEPLWPSGIDCLYCMGRCMRREDRISEMMKMARELAGHGHRPQMIEAVLVANGFREAQDFIDQPHISRELRDIADRARRQEEPKRSIREGVPPRGH